MKQIRNYIRPLLFVIMGVLFVSTNAYSQSKSVSGTVKEKDGQTLPGVTVLVQGTGNGIVTDIDGNFTISASPADKLVFTFIGMREQVIEVGSKSTFQIVLEQDLISIDEVIAVGYSTKKRTEISSSVVNVSAEQLSAATTTAMDGVDLLQGRVAGLTIMDNNYDSGSSPSVRIRGTGSLNASNEPLWVVDGVISSSTAFNPNDVESITVMKDAGATGLYGSKASGGVIVVTTKSGKAGTDRFTVNASYGFNNPWWGNYEGFMNSEQLYDYYHEAFMNDNDYLTNPNTEEKWMSTITKGKTRDEVIANEYDWLNALYPKGATQKYTVSHSGGNEKSTHYISLNYNQSDGVLRGSQEEQFSGTMNLSHNFSSKFKFDARLYASMRNVDLPIIAQNMRVAPFDVPYNEDGTLKDKDDIKADWISSKSTNQLTHEQIGNENSEQRMSFIPNISFSYQILSNLKISSTTKYSYSSTLKKDYKDGRSWANQNNPNKGYLGETNAYVKRTQATGQNILNNELLTYNDQFGENSLNVLLGIEFQKSYNDGFWARNTGLVNGIDVLSATTGIPQVSGTPTETARQSFFSQLNYDYAKKYFLTASYRRDGSSKFGSDNRYGNFYSASASWLVTNEEFMQGTADFISNLKLRTSYGVTGNDNFPNYSAVETYSLSGADYNYESGASPTQFSNPDLTWEKAYTTNIGVDVGLWKRLDLTFDFYNIQNQDILYEVPIDPTSGFEYAWQNVGDILNRGFEFSASGYIIDKKDFNWYANLAFAYNHNEVVALTDDTEDGIIDAKQKTILKVGEDIRSTYVIDYVGADPETGHATWNTVDENGNINGTTNWELDPNIAYKTENMSPKYTGGLNNKIFFKGFTLDVMMSYAGGFYTNLSNTMWFRHGEKVIQGQSAAALKDRWQQPGDQAYFPKIYYGVYGKTEDRPNKPNGINIVKGDYVKINYISLGYAVPSSLTNMLKLADMDVYCRFNNPYLFVIDDNFTYSTPEAAGNGGTESVNNKLRPVMQSLIFGVNISF